MDKEIAQHPPQLAATPAATSTETGAHARPRFEAGVIPTVGPQAAADDARGDQVTASEQAFAADGISGTGGPLPHAGQIAASFGPAHAATVHAITAHVGGTAGDATGAMNAEAYATRGHVAFASSPTLHVAAHEAAHVIQQQGGLALDGGVGAEGDAHEQHADAVADRVAAGESAADLLGPATSGSASSAAPLQFLRKAGGDAALNRGSAQAVDEFSKTYPDGGDGGNLKTRGGFADKTVRVACDYHVGVRDPISGQTLDVMFHEVAQDRGIGLFTSMTTFGQYDTRKDTDSDVLKCEGIEYKTSERYNRSSGFLEKFSEPTSIERFAATAIPALAARIARFEQTGETGNTPKIDARDNAALLAARAAK